MILKKKLLYCYFPSYFKIDTYILLNWDYYSRIHTHNLPMFSLMHPSPSILHLVLLSIKLIQNHEVLTNINTRTFLSASMIGFAKKKLTCKLMYI